MNSSKSSRKLNNDTPFNFFNKIKLNTNARKKIERKRILISNLEKVQTVRPNWPKAARSSSRALR